APRGLTPVGRVVGAGRAVAIGDVAYRVHVAGAPGHGHRHDRPCPWRDGGFDPGRVDVLRLPIDVDEDRARTHVLDHVGGRGESQGRGDDLIARADTAGDQRQV